MKIALFCCKLFTFGLFLFSCTNEYDELALDKDSRKDLKELSSAYSCNGSGQCLPVVTIMHLNKYSSTPGTMITWTYGYTPHENLTFSYKLSSGYTVSENISSSGSLFFSNNSTDYTFTCTFSCKELMSSNCSSCKKTYSFVVKEDSGSLGTLGDCQRNYLSYSMQSNYSSIILKTESSGSIIEDKKNYMKVDSYKIYKQKSWSELELVQSGKVVPDVTVINYSYEFGCHYEIRFYSSTCENNDKHYLYATYFERIVRPFLTLMKIH